MTKRTRKLSIKKETLKSLTSESLSQAMGGAVLGLSRTSPGCYDAPAPLAPNGSPYTKDLIEAINL
jgi:hypothetical protein